jgi:hypothetical protein
MRHQLAAGVTRTLEVGDGGCHLARDVHHKPRAFVGNN